MSSNTAHRPIFFAHYTAPFKCYFCSKRVPPDEVTIHHIDGDHSNNDPINLAPSHSLCHKRHHQLGVPRTEDAKQKMRAHVKTLEHRQKISAANKRAWDRRRAEGRTTRVVSAQGLENMRRAAKTRKKPSKRGERCTATAVFHGGQCKRYTQRPTGLCPIHERMASS